MGKFQGGNGRMDRGEIQRVSASNGSMKQSNLMPSHKAVRAGNMEIHPDTAGSAQQHPNLRDADRDGM